MVEETKNVWMYELPLTESPVDAYAALDIGPHQAVIGTLFRPNHADQDHPLQGMLADTWTWNNQSHVLTVKLKKDITYGNHDPITADQFARAHEYLRTKLGGFTDDSIFGVLKNADFKADHDQLKITLTHLPKDFDLEYFMREALTHPMSGVIHPKNLASLQKGESIEKTWITSGAYLISKWTAKEIELISRSDYPGGMQKDVIRTIKFQSAPVKNPACDFLQGRIGDEKQLSEQSMTPTDTRATIFWVCRSYEQEGFCKDPANRKTLADLFSGKQTPSFKLLAGKKLRYRIPVGSDSFRNAIREKIESLMTQSGGKAEETSYFFKNSKDTDLELEFVVTPEASDLDTDGVTLAKLSTRLGKNAVEQPNLVGIIESFPLQIFMKNLKGDVYSKLFIEPDLDEKKLPL
jgi:hypothetical protein